MSNAIIIRVRHIRQANLCMKGSRLWFAARNWHWGSFVADGRPASDFIATGDPLAMRAVEAARREASDGC